MELAIGGLRLLKLETPTILRRENENVSLASTIIDDRSTSPHLALLTTSSIEISTAKSGAHIANGGPVSDFYERWITFTVMEALERLGHVDEVVNDPDYKFEFPTPDDRPGPPIISFSDASFGYPGGFIIFQVAWEGRAYDYCMESLKNVGFPVDGLAFDPDLVIRGLVILKEKGNLVKAGRFGYMKRVMHAIKLLSTQAISEIMGEAVVYLQMVDKYASTRYLIPELGPCSLKITYSAHTDLSVKFQSHRSRDYTNPMLPVASLAIDATGQFSLGLDRNKIESESNVLLASIENMQYVVTLDVLHMIAMFDKNGGVQALIQYPDVQTAINYTTFFKAVLLKIHHFFQDFCTKKYKKSTKEGSETLLNLIT
ncbi:unnamed protein product [Lactuca virosa]|uniref:Uncharacterized protein n=1 Tax=Lactuca virosa TaxID=75947 RepID=A0AAU9LWD0_9ASTR|nr:unnamed protein product [Lactuca virosa]